MKKYMVIIDLPKNPPEEFLLLLPTQRLVAERMMHAGFIQSYALTGDRSNLWVVLVADSIEEAMQYLGQFPIIRFANVELRELAFHQMGVLPISQLSLN